MDFHSAYVRNAAVAALVAAATIAFAGCSGGGGGGGSDLAGCLSYGSGGNGGSGSCSGSGAPNPSPTPDAGAQSVALLLTGQNPVTVAPYGGVLGYHAGDSSAAFAGGPNTVNLTANQPVQFYNVEATAGGLPHTASNLGAWSGSFPAAGPVAAQQNPSPAGTTINTAGFSTGTIEPGAVSRVYNSGAAGMTVIGCFYHYNSNNMRTVVIVM
ncbi:MAG TPA: hypothetical protein VEJ41_05140 [Candidatus Acidoferrales bacterium]|nr:hypothetical protein [Candidatus Acidoferrales bacterium]